MAQSARSAASVCVGLGPAGLLRAGDTEDEQEPAPDHLADIHAVLRGERRVRTQAVLRRASPSTTQPSTRTGTSKTSPPPSMTTASRPPKSHGVMVVRAEDIAEALTERNHDDDERGGRGEWGGERGGSRGRGEFSPPPPRTFLRPLDRVNPRWGV